MCSKWLNKCEMLILNIWFKDKKINFNNTQQNTAVSCSSLKWFLCLLQSGPSANKGLNFPVTSLHMYEPWHSFNSWIKFSLLLPSRENWINKNLCFLFFLFRNIQSSSPSLYVNFFFSPQSIFWCQIYDKNTMAQCVRSLHGKFGTVKFWILSSVCNDLKRYKLDTETENKQTQTPL